MSEQRKTEIMALCSGKGGSGKSLMCACFGYALLRGGQRVLMIDGDPATHGLSLFLLGPKGQEQVASLEDQNTFSGALERFQKTGNAHFESRAIPRRGDDHRVTYNAILSGKGLYGEGTPDTSAMADLNRGNFRAGIRHLFDQLRSSGEYDYVLVDTRGGSSFESTDLCALADSFVIVTEPDDNSFYQNRNLVSRIAVAAREVEASSSLCAVIVNKAVGLYPQEGAPYLDTLEVPFRNQLVQEFGLRFEDTHPVPVSPKALLAYKAHKIPYRSAPESMFSMATLSAYTGILGIPHAPHAPHALWTAEEVDRWNVLVNTVDRAVKEKQETDEQKKQGHTAHEEEFLQLRATVAANEMTIANLERDADLRLSALHREYESKVAGLEHDLVQRNALYERELARADALTATIGQVGGAAVFYEEAFPAAKPVAAHPDPVATTAHAGELPPFPLAETGNEPEVHTVEEFEPEEAGRSLPSREAFASFIGQMDAARPGSSMAGMGLLLLLVVGVAAFLLLHHTPRKALAAAPAAQTQGRQVAAVAPAEVPRPIKDEGQQNDFAVLLAGGKSLNATEKGAPSAAYEAQLALRSGYPVQVYQRGGRYTALVPWETQPEAEEGLQAVKVPFSGRWASTSALVTVSDWCPQKTAQEPLVINDKEVPVWTCETSLAASSKSHRPAER